MREKKIKNSSNVERIRHWSNNVTVDYKGGSSYTYLDVENDHVKGLFDAESVGVYLHEFIKPNYGVEKETEKTLECIDEIMKQVTIIDKQKAEKNEK